MIGWLINGMGKNQALKALQSVDFKEIGKKQGLSVDLAIDGVFDTKASEELQDALYKAFTEFMDGFKEGIEADRGTEKPSQ